MVRNPKCIGVLSFRDGKQTEQLKSIVFPYITEFEVMKDSNDMSTKAYVKLPSNLSYTIRKKRPTFSTALEETLNDVPTSFESSIQQLSTGLQIWDANYGNTSATNTKKNYWNDVKSIANKPKTQPLENTTAGIYYGQRYSYVSNYTWENFRAFKRDGDLFDTNNANRVGLQVSKVYPSSESDIVQLFKIGDLFTLRWVYENASGDSSFASRSGPTTPGSGVFLNTENFYISNIKSEGEFLILELEGWTWMMRQIPCRLSLQSPITILEFLETYVMPVILKSTYIDSIVTRDAGGKVSDTSFGSRITTNLLDNKIGPLRINITNMYDLLVTLKDTYLINFTETQWAQPHGLFLTIGYGYRKALFSTISSDFYKKYAASQAQLQNIENPSVFLYRPGWDCATVNLTKINFNAYAVLVRITSNTTFNKLAKNTARKTITPKTDAKGVQSFVVEGVNKGQIEVTYGDKKAYGLITDPTDTLGGKTIIRSQDNDNANIVNIKLVGIRDKEYLLRLAKKTYNKLKFANPINGIGVKPFFSLGRIPSVFEFVTIENLLESSLSGDYIVTSTRIVMNGQDGYLVDINLGLRFGFKGQETETGKLTKDDAESLIENEKNH